MAVLPVDPTGLLSFLPRQLRGIAWKQPCRVATTANITISTALNVGDTIDGVTLADGDRVLVKNQSTGSQNGIYVAGATPTRAYDMDQDQTTEVVAEEVLGAFVFVIAGTANGGKLFYSTNTTIPTVLGTTSIVFTEFTTGGGVADITDLPTAETDTDLVLHPDGVGGVEWGPDATGSGRWELAVITGSPPDPLYADGDFLYIFVP